MTNQPKIQHGGPRPTTRPDDKRRQRKKPPGEKFVPRLISLPVELDARLDEEDNASGLIQRLLVEHYTQIKIKEE